MKQDPFTSAEGPGKASAEASVLATNVETTLFLLLSSDIPPALSSPSSSSVLVALRVALDERKEIDFATVVLVALVVIALLLVVKLMLLLV